MINLSSNDTLSNPEHQPTLSTLEKEIVAIRAVDDAIDSGELGGLTDDEAGINDPQSPAYKRVFKLANKLKGKLFWDDYTLEQQFGSMGRSPKAEINLVKRSLRAMKKVPSEQVIMDLFIALEGDNLAINELSLKIAYKGVTLDDEADLFAKLVELSRKMGLKAPSMKRFFELLPGFMDRRKINPARDYFNRLSPLSSEDFKAKHGFSPEYIAEKLTGNDHYIVQLGWKVQMIGLIRRVFNPGAKHDHCLALLSETKGWRKTTFLEKLLPDDSLYVSVANFSSEKSFYELLRGKVVFNIDEADKILTGAEGTTVKRELTANKDTYRAAYGFTAVDHKRHGVFFATANSYEIIADQLGDRRYIPVKLEKAIDLEWFEANRDDYWAYYLHEYQQGHPNHLESNEIEALLDLQREYKTSPAWLDVLDGIIQQLRKRYPQGFVVTASDLTFILKDSSGSTKRYMLQDIKDVCKTEYGAIEARPKLDNGSKPSKPRLYFKGNDLPVSISQTVLDVALGVYKQYGDQAVDTIKAPDPVTGM